MEQTEESAAITIACDLLLESLKRLADGGGVEAACRLAGRACVRLRHDHPLQARRFDVLLHRMTPKLGWRDPPRAGAATGTEPDSRSLPPGCASS